MARRERAGEADDGDRSKRRAGFVPYALLSPGMLWLILFFLVPLFTLARTSLSVKESRFAVDATFNWHVENFTNALSDYSDQFIRSFAYAGAATLAWATVLSDNGPALSLVDRLSLDGLFDAVGFTSDGRLLSTQWAVVGGLTYNFLPFMILPIYVSLEKIDLRLSEAAKDLYNNGWNAFRKVVLPLSLPGIFAGSLLTFIPAAGDFINARFLGGPNNTMIGTVVQDRFLVQLDYPTAGALSFILMIVITIATLVYARVLGTDDLI